MTETPAKKADRYFAIARALERQAPEHPTHVEMAMRDVAARFRFNAVLALGSSDETLVEAGFHAAKEAGKICTVEELMSVMEKRFCMRCLGISFVGVEW